MTTFQDPQPQSRRAVRQSERGEAAESSVGFTQPTDAPAMPQTFTDAEAPHDWTPPAASGRRSAQPADDASSTGAEPLNYSTQARPNVPSYDGPSFRPRSSANAPRATDDLAPTEAIQKVDQPTYRVRDYSPEGRRAAAPAPSWISPVPPAAPVVSQTPAPAPLDYQTEVRSAPVQPTPPAPVDEVPADIAPRLDRTLTRRELRALQQAEERGAAPVAPLVEPEAATPVVETTAWPFAGLAAPEAPVAPVGPAALVEPALPPVAPEPAANTALTNAIAEFDALTKQPAPQERAIEEAPASQWTPPLGHWSVQAGLEDETQPYESTINRTVGSGTVTTNALVLPSIPEGTDIRGPLTGTGEVMLTGSIDLPHAFSSTGASARVEHEGMDALFDLHDAEIVSTDSQPVRAMSAVSTHNSGQGVTHTQKPKGTRALTALIISAASMAVVVVGLLVAVFALRLF